MKLCLVSPHYPPMSFPCGAADFCSQLARQLHDVGHDVTVVTSNEAVKPDDWPFRVVVISGRWSLGHVRTIGKWLGSQSFTLVDLQYEAHMYQRRWPPLLLPLFVRNTPVFLTFHSQVVPKLGGRLWRYAQMNFFKGLIFYSKPFHDRWATRTGKGSRFLLQGFPANICQAVPTGARPLIEKLKAGALHDAPLLVYFGHIVAGRGIEDVIEVLARLKQRGRNFHFSLLSQFNANEEDYHRGLLGWIRDRALETQVSFPGRLTNEAISRFLTAADAAVLPFPDGASFKNGSLAAAINHAIPIVTTRTDLTELVLLEGDAMATYVPGDKATLETLLDRVITDPAYRAELSHRIEVKRNLFSWNEYLRARVEFCERLTAARRMTLN